MQKKRLSRFLKIGVLALLGLILWVGYYGLPNGETYRMDFKEHPEEIGRIVKTTYELILESGGVGEWPGEGKTIGSAYGEKDENGNTVLTHELVGFTDDSVQGERNRWVLEPVEDGAFKVIYKGSQFMCWRGRGAGKWRSWPLCP